MSSAAITVNVKASNDSKYAISIPPSDTVLELKNLVAQRCDTPAERIRLIFSGRVLKDHDSLETYKIADGYTVHMVRSAVAVAPASTSLPAPASSLASAPTPLSASNTARPLTSSAAAPDPIAPTSSALPNPWSNLSGAGGMGGAGAFGGIGPIGAMGGMGSMGSMGGMEPAIMSQMMQDPNFAQYMSSMLQNPQVLESMISMNPALRAIGPQARQILQSPQFQQMISNPDALRRVAQMGPQLGGGLGMGGMGAFGGAGMYNPWASGGVAPGTTSATSHMPTSTPAPAPAPASASANPMASFWAQQLAAMGGSATGSGMPNVTRGQNQQALEERFQVQLKQLNDMGFWDAAKNIRALVAAGGNVHGAIELLFTGFS